MRKTLGRKIYHLHIRLTRRINDTHIFLQSALPALQELQQEFSTSKHEKDRRYDTPKLNKKSFSNRTDSEVAAIFRKFLQRELYETLIVSVVSEFEAFLGDVVSMVLKAFPQKLLITLGDERDEITRNHGGKSVSVDAILRSGSYEALIDGIIKDRCEALFFAPPKKYVDYIGKAVSVSVGDVAFTKFLEIKASRDVIIHNDGIANAIYLSKSGAHARAQRPGEKLAVDGAYFDHVVMIIKRISGIIARDAQAKFDKPVGD
jgi:hypothetical protein